MMSSPLFVRIYTENGIVCLSEFDQFPDNCVYYVPNNIIISDSFVTEHLKKKKNKVSRIKRNLRCKPIKMKSLPWIFVKINKN